MKIVTQKVGLGEAVGQSWAGVCCPGHLWRCVLGGLLRHPLNK